MQRAEPRYFMQVMTILRKLCPKENDIFKQMPLLIVILTNYCARALVRIRFHQQQHPKPHYTLALPDVTSGSIRGLTISNVYFKIVLHLVRI